MNALAVQNPHQKCDWKQEQIIALLDYNYYTEIIIIIYIYTHVCVCVCVIYNLHSSPS